MTTKTLYIVAVTLIVLASFASGYLMGKGDNRAPIVIDGGVLRKF